MTTIHSEGITSKSFEVPADEVGEQPDVSEAHADNGNRIAVTRYSGQSARVRPGVPASANCPSR